MRTDPLSRLADGIDRVTSITGRLVSWLTLGMVLVTFLVVALRYLFDTGFIWMQESVIWMHALVFLLAAAYTLRHDEHVRVDIFYRRMSARSRAVVDLLGTLLLLIPTAFFIFVTSLDFVAQSWRVGESSPEPGGLPALYLLKGAIPLAAALLIVQGVALLLRSFVVMRNPGAVTNATDKPQGGKV